MAPGPGQGDGGRRYRLTSGVPTLDFTSTQRWGVQVWLRSTLAVGASPTAYTPDTAHPAVTTAASPMPIVPRPPPAPPGVPMGSTPDAPVSYTHLDVYKRQPFTVWVGSPSLKQVKDVDFTSSQRGGGLLLRWGGDEAAFIVVDFDPINPNAAVGLFAHRTAATMNDVVAVSTAPAPGPVHVQLVIKCSGATSALLVNGMNAKVRIRTVEDVINDDTWKPIELVGLPCEQPWGATAYDSSDQGLVAAPVPPFEAAVQRLKRGMPPLGWPPMTQTGRLAPDWVDPDPELVVKEVVQSLLPEIAELYDPGVPERLQFTLSSDRAVPGLSLIHI